MTPLVSLLLAAAAAHPADDGPTLRRFALLVGANDGGADRVRLRYAETDAQSMDHVLRELGGVTETDRILLLDPDRARFLDSLTTLRRLVEEGHAAGLTTEVLLYYSGHSDDEGLLLKGDHVSYGELRHLLDTLSADVRIALLDSCGSGRFTRAKGGERKPAFLVDSATQVKGHAFLTSSSADEVAQESDRIGSSFFTHALVSGLRGAADTTGDGRVTLNEAYQFAFNETLARTEQSVGGAQHPAYDIQLVGSGDLVMTDLRDTSAGLHLSKGIEGRLFIRDGGGHLVVELEKGAGHPVDLALEAGDYQIMLDHEGHLARAAVSLQDGRRVVLNPEMFTAVAGEATVSRGPVEVYPVVPVTFGFFYTGVGHPTTNNLQLNLFVGGTTRLIGGTLSAIGSWIDEDATGVQLSAIFDHQGKGMSGLDLTGVLALDRGPLLGVQGAGVAAAAAGVHGAQLSGVTSVSAGDVRGVQLSGVASVSSGSMVGLQGAGVVSVANATWGAQLAGVGNVAAGPARGLEAAGVFNWSRDDLRGLQASGVINYAHGLTGAQIGLLNIGGDVHGAQLGLVNVASRVSAQIGLLNFAGNAGATVGLLNFVAQGQLHGSFWTGDTAPINAGLKLGSRSVFSVLAVGYDPRGSQPKFFDYIGIGVHVPIVANFWFDPDLGAGNYSLGYSTAFQTFHDTMAKVRLNFGYSFFEHLGIFAGVSGNALVRYADTQVPDIGYGLVYRTPTTVHGVTATFWLGPYIGIQI
jgi:hypothetical protein